MAYRNGTYIAFHANGTVLPGKSDMDYYRLLKMWSEKSDDDFSMIDSHEKTAAVRDSSKRATLRARLQERLSKSKNMVLIIGETTRMDDDWVPFEIQQAVDQYKIPIIAAYTEWDKRILSPQYLSGYWPAALASRINSGTARVVHIPFKKLPLTDAVANLSHSNLPPDSLSYYTADTYDRWGIA